MKKLSHLMLITLLMSLFAAPVPVEARKGKTSDTTEQSSKTATPKAAKSTQRKKSDSFTSTAKTKQAKSAWQEYSRQKQDTSPPASSPPSILLDKDTQSLEKQLEALQNKAKSDKKRKKDKKLAEQIAALEQQIAETKRQQQFIAVAQTFAQTVLNRQRQPTANAPVAVKTQPAATVPAKAQSQGKSGVSWGFILLLVGGIAVFFIWRSRSKSSTLYRI